MIFLSIDIDYYLKGQLPTFLKHLNLFTHCRDRISAVTNHHQMLDIANRFNFDTLVNVDAHTDLVEEHPDLDLSCATWCSFLNRKRSTNYLWIHPFRKDIHSIRNGECGSIYSGAIFPRDLSTVPTRRIGFNDVNERSPFNPTQLLPQAVHISFCISPTYAETDIICAFDTWCRTNKIPITEGDYSDDDYEQKMTDFFKNLPTKG
jgi:hypothetical protein